MEKKQQQKITNFKDSPVDVYHIIISFLSESADLLNLSKASKGVYDFLQSNRYDNRCENIKFYYIPPSFQPTTRITGLWIQLSGKGVFEAMYKSFKYPSFF